MPTIPPILMAFILFSAISFLFFGFSCLTSPFMILEFNRYGLGSYRPLIGVLQILGSLAILFGIYFIPLAILGSAGLSLLMFMGLFVRIRLKDSILKSAPAFLYAVLNLGICLTLASHFV